MPIAEVPGFTRGLDFAGNLAFVGLSQVRECAVFSGIPIVERLAEDQRTCGVCAIDLATGQVVALLRFETRVQEIFAVTVLPGKRYPDLIDDDQKLLENSFVVPDAALADVPASLRGPAEPTRGAAGSGGNGSGPRVPPRVAAPARPRQAEAAPSRQGSGARSARLQACPIIVSQTTSEKEMNHETATMVPQLPDAAADAPSVPATARDVVGRR